MTWNLAWLNPGLEPIEGDELDLETIKNAGQYYFCDSNTKELKPPSCWPVSLQVAVVGTDLPPGEPGAAPTGIKFQHYSARMC